VHATPADDLPRLVLADWLEEHGEPERAEFIRVQCELERHPHADRLRDDTFTDDEGVRPEFERGVALLRRERELWGRLTVGNELVENSVRWLDRQRRCVIAPTTIGRSLLTSHPRFEFRRGFLFAVNCPLDDWFGRPCADCYGTGRGERQPFSGYDDCDTCDGRGRLPGLGPRLVKEHSIERVTLTDRVAVGPDHAWRADQWRETAAEDEPALLPWSVAERLTGFVRKNAVEGGTGRRFSWSFATADDARSALSAAALAWAAVR